MTISDANTVHDLDILLSDADFQRISGIAKSGWGLNLEAGKKPLIKSRLSNRLKKLGLSGFGAYCDLVEAGDPIEIDHFVIALTTNVTHFYRENHHFEHLENSILPKLLSKAKEGKRVRIWSAGCSSGQEPYSLAGSLLKVDSKVSNYDLKILASDIDSTVLERAALGQYRSSDCRFPSEEHESRVFRNTIESSGYSYVREELKNLISFRHLNLVQEWPISGCFDIIMCRNVAIYFDRETQIRLWSRFAKVLVDDGSLFIGHSERIPDPASLGLRADGTTTYRQVGSGSTTITSSNEVSKWH